MSRLGTRPRRERCALCSFFCAVALTTMRFLEAFTQAMRRKLNRAPRVTLRHIHQHLLDLQEAVNQVLQNQHDQFHKQERFMATTKERLDSIGTGIDEVSAQLTKAQAEIEKEVADLKALIEAGGNTSPEIDAALSSIETKVAALKPVSQALDDLNPDQTT